MWGLQMHRFVLLRFWCSLAIFGHLWPSGIGGICASRLGLCGRAEFQHHKWSPEGAPGSGGREWQMAWSTESSKMESKEYENYERIEWKTDENRYLGGQGLVEILFQIFQPFQLPFRIDLYDLSQQRIWSTNSYGMHRYATVLLSHPACFVIMLVMLVMLESRHIATHDPASSWAMQSFQAHFEQFGQISDCVVSNSDLRLPFRTCAIWAERWEKMRRPEKRWILWHVVTCCDLVCA